MKTNVTVSKEELDATMRTAQSLLLVATHQTPAVGVTALIMAGAIGAAASGIPLEDYMSQVDRASTEVYKNAGALKAKLN
jgi:hypothetical protein